MRTLLHIIFWPNVVMGLPFSFIGLLIAESYLTVPPDCRGVDEALTLGSVIVVGWWLLYGYGCAAFQRDTPVAWRSFWWTSFTINLAVVVGAIGKGLLIPSPAPSIALASSGQVNTILELSIFWGWPLIMTVLSYAVLAIDQKVGAKLSKKGDA
jgi:hypothetical protein